MFNKKLMKFSLMIFSMSGFLPMAAVIIKNETHYCAEVRLDCTVWSYIANPDREKIDANRVVSHLPVNLQARPNVEVNEPLAVSVFIPAATYDAAGQLLPGILDSIKLAEYPKTCTFPVKILSVALYDTKECNLGGVQEAAGSCQSDNAIWKLPNGVWRCYIPIPDESDIKTLPVNSTYTIKYPQPSTLRVWKYGSKHGE